MINSLPIRNMWRLLLKMKFKRCITLDVLYNLSRCTVNTISNALNIAYYVVAVRPAVNSMTIKNVTKKSQPRFLLFVKQEWFYEYFMSLSRMKNYLSFIVKGQIFFFFFFCDFKQIFIFSADLKGKSLMPNYIQICPVGVEMVHAGKETDGQTWRH